MNDAPHRHGPGVDQEEMRAAVEALGADAEIARRADVPQERVGRFRNGYERLSAREAAAVGAAVAAIKAERAAAAADNVVHFSAAGGGKVGTARGGKAKARETPESPQAAPEPPGGATDADEAQRAYEAGQRADEEAEERLLTPMPMVMVTKPMPALVLALALAGGQARGGVDDLLAKAAALAAGDIEGAKAIIEAAVLSHIDPLKKAGLCVTLKKALGRGFAKAVDDAWSFAEARLRLHADELAAAAAAASARAKKVKQETERARLWPLVEKLANRRDLIEYVADIAQAIGVVGERKTIKANYIAMSSRLLAELRVLSLVNTGLASAGKSWLMYTVARFFPAECVIEITTGSPKAMMYFGEDSRAWSHKIIALGETAGFIASSDTQDNSAGAIFREFLTKGSATHYVTEKDKDGHHVTRAVKIEGPVSLTSTSARANLDPEMEARLLEAPIDESPRATAAIQHAQLSGETVRRAKAAAPAVEELIALQRWLQTHEGLRVVIPDDLLESIAAVGGLPLTVQTRRDVPLFLCAVRACAVIHLAQRQRDAEGQVIAQFEDYEAAHDAIDGFLAASYSPTLKPPEIAVLAAIEDLIVEDQKRRKAIEAALKPGEYVSMDHLNSWEAKAKFTYDELGARLQMKSRKTLSKQIKALKRAKAISLVVQHQGWKTPISTWELLKKAPDAAAEKCGRFMPPPEAVIEMLVDPVTRRKQLDRILSEGESSTDWRAYAAGGGANDGDDSATGDADDAAPGGSNNREGEGDEVV